MNTRCGYATLIGAPNAGKSTLLNALIGSDVSIVTPKPQTTRVRMRGIITKDHSQIVFIDTPGIFTAKPGFEESMVTQAWQGADEADIVLVIIDASRGLNEEANAILEGLKTRKKPTVLVLNKIDKLPDKTILPTLAQSLFDYRDFERSFMISAEKNNGVKDILEYLAARMPESPWLYPEDALTDQNERTMAEEITREQCFLKLHAELPYGLMVTTEAWQEKIVSGKRELRINQVVVVERESHKKIVLGANGQSLKAIGSAARYKIRQMLDAGAVHLFLFVKVDPSWKKKAETNE